MGDGLIPAHHLFTIMTVLRKIFFAGLLILMGCPSGFTNNLKLEGLQLIDSSHVHFKVSWSHSWQLKGVKPPYNHDAAWIFLKYKRTGQSWHHLEVSPSKRNHDVNVPGSPKIGIRPVKDQKGIFLKRTAKGSGKIPRTEITLELAKPLPEGSYEIRIFGIEMVYIPKDSFYLGDRTSNFRFKKAGTDNPFLVAAESEILTGKQSGRLTADSQYQPEANIPKAYPNGFSDGYVMKHEISQEQYVDFLNTLSKKQQANHIERSPSADAGTFAYRGGPGNRNGIVIEKPAQEGNPALFACDVQEDESFNDPDDGQARACNFLKWADLSAYLDWAGLRPMTELEFEKICRGPKKPVQNEFAWGTPKVTDANTIEKDGTIYEKAVDPLSPNEGMASHGYRGPKGPLRNGFAGNDSTDRLSIGASYYGVLEMSGNLWELCVVTNKAGLTFSGNNGDGVLGNQGYADEPNWPGKAGKGAGFRGGAWNSGIIPGFRDLAVSDRFYVFNAPERRRNTNGGRGYRSLKK